MSNQTQINTPQDDEISLWDVVNLLKEGWLWLAGGLLLGLAGAVGFVVVSPPQYEATGVIQPAVVGLPPNVTKGVEVEPIVQTLERLKLATFYNEAQVQACQAPSELALASGVKAIQIKGNSLIQLSYRAPSTAAAGACINSVVAQLAKSQDALAEPTLKMLEEQLVLTRKQLMEALSFQAQLEKLVVSSSDTASLLMLNVLSKRDEVVRLQRLELEKRAQLSAPLTQPLHLLEPVYVSEKVVAPKKLFVLLVGLLGGFVFGGLLFFMRRICSGK